MVATAPNERFNLSGSPPVSIRLSETVAESVSSDELIQRVDSAIRTNPHLNGHRVYFKQESGMIVLHGRVSSFYQKQMAQETLKRLQGVDRIVNHLEVDWRSSVSY